MAKRLNPRHQEMVRAKIQATKLIQRLQAEALGDKEIMTSGQRDSAKYLLGKSLSNPPEDQNLHVDGGVDFKISGV